MLRTVVLAEFRFKQTVKLNFSPSLQTWELANLGLPTVPYFPGHPVFRPMCPASRLIIVPFFRMHVKQICGVGNKLIIRLQTHHTVSLVLYASSVYLLGSSWGIAKLVCFHATTVLLLTYSWIGDYRDALSYPHSTMSVTSIEVIKKSWTLRHHLVLFFWANHRQCK